MNIITIRKTIFFPILIFVFTFVALSFALETKASFAENKSIYSQGNDLSLLNLKHSSSRDLNTRKPFNFLMEDLKPFFSKQVNYSSDTSINLFSPRQEAPQSGSSNVSTDALAQTGNYTIIDPPGSISTIAFSINEAGDVAGHYYGSDNKNHSFKFSNGNYTIIDPPGSISSYARAMNDAGDVAGFYDSSNKRQWFKFSNGNYTIFDPTGAISTNYLTAINNAGDVVGYAEDIKGITRGYKFSNGNFTIIEQPGAGYTQALSINDAGDVAGFYIKRAINGYDLEGYGFKFSNGNYTTIDAPGSTRTWVTAINDAGDIAGYYSDSDYKKHGFKFSNGNYTTIDPPGSISTIASSINEAGDVVGLYQGSDNKWHGFKFSNGNYTTIDPPGSSYTDAFSINDAGDVAGWYIGSDGRQHGFKFSNGTPDLRVVKVEPVQVIYRDEYLRDGSPGATAIALIADKPTALRVTVSINKKISELPTGITAIPIRVSYGGQSIDRSIPRSNFKDNGSESIAVEIFNKPFIPRGSSSFVVDIDPAKLIAEANEENNKFTLKVETVIRKVNMQYVSILSPLYAIPNSISSTAAVSDDFISATFPIAPIPPGGSVSPNYLAGSPDFRRDETYPAYTKGMIKDLADLSSLAGSAGLDKIFGVASKDYFVKHGEVRGDKITRGFTFVNDNSAIIMDSSENPMKGAVAAHELAHMYGIREEEYTTQKPAVGKQASPGYWVDKGIRINDGTLESSNKFCFMGADVYDDKWWIDKGHYDHLLDNIPITLNSTASNSLTTYDGEKTAADTNSASYVQQALNSTGNFLVVSAIVGKEGSLEPLAWNTTSLGSPTKGKPQGNFAVKVLNSAGQTLSEVSVPVEFVIHLEPEGAFPTDIAPLVVKVPYPINAASVQILKDNQPIKTIAITGKLLRDTINAIPDSGFNGNAATQRTDLLSKVALIEGKIASGNNEQARQLLINELKPSVQQGLTEGYTVQSALQLTKPKVLSVIDGEINRLIAPTAASVTVGGRVITSRGRGIRNVVVTMTDSNGNTRTATSSSFGYYRFTDVPAGETYIFTAIGKRFSFGQNSQVHSIVEDIDDINFVASE